MNDLAREILTILENNKFESYIIGGYPRDKYLGKENKDIDICTKAKYQDLKKLFPEIKTNNYSSHLVTYKNEEFEITTFRKEKKYIFNRFPKKIKYTKKLAQDLKRRDFVINTLCIDKNDNYIDLNGARQDLDNKIIRLVGNKKSLMKDSLRTLRAIRFATTLNFKLDKKLEKAIIKYGYLTKNLSYDRKKQELDKIFESDNALYGIELIKKFNLQTYLDINIENIILTEKKGIWAQVIKNDKYKFTKKEANSIKIIQKLLNKEFDLYDLYLYGIEIFKIVNTIKQENKNITKLYNNLPIKDRSEIEITFFEISNTVYATRKNIGKIYEEIEKQIIYKKIKNEKNAIIRYLKEELSRIS
ncbi:MAG: hypothetical protein J6D28_02000 [Bacilli bacterium]|nr:hypothetical protein [Bacilli bacterium]